MYYVRVCMYSLDGHSTCTVCILCTEQQVGQHLESFRLKKKNQKQYHWDAGQVCRIAATPGIVTSNGAAIRFLARPGCLYLKRIRQIFLHMQVQVMHLQIEIYGLFCVDRRDCVNRPADLPTVFLLSPGVFINGYCAVCTVYKEYMVHSAMLYSAGWHRVSSLCTCTMYTVLYLYVHSTTYLGTYHIAHVHGWGLRSAQAPPHMQADGGRHVCLGLSSSLHRYM